MLQVVAIFLFIYFASRVEYGICYTLRHDGFRSCSHCRFPFDRTPVGFLMSRMTSDAQHVSEAWLGLVDFMWALVYLLASVMSMLLIDWKVR